MSKRELRDKKQLSIKDALVAEKPARIQLVPCNPTALQNCREQPAKFPEFGHVYGVHFLPPLPQTSVSSSNPLGITSEEIEMTTEMYASALNLRGYILTNKVDSIKQVAQRVGIQIYEPRMSMTTICDSCVQIDTRITETRLREMRSH